MSVQKIVRNGYTVEFGEPVVYVDNEKRRRSGHMTHAMAEFAPDCFIDFNSNCSALRHGGHMPYGWVEYRISRDGGKTYSEPQELAYAKESFLDGIYTISVEKAVACDDGTIVALCLRNSALAVHFCEPWATPTVIRSTDEGQTWSEPVECIPYAGRIYDAFYRDGVIYVLIFCNEHFLGSDETHKYRLYKSFDRGQTFTEVSVIPFDTLRRGYGAMIYDTGNRLHAYAYNEADETVIDHAISTDDGATWTVEEPCFVDRGVRNPQIAYLDGVYLLHGRSASVDSFVFYTSTDATHWDPAIVAAKTLPFGQYYSNYLNLNDENGHFLLVQYSESYHRSKVNVKHMEIRIRKHSD
jgi:hypothetical protein